MTRYDKIWVDDKDSDWEVTGEDYSGVVSKGRVSPVYKAIVMSIDELRELWDAGVHHGEEAQRKDIWDKLKSPDFKSHLTSKGISI